MIGNLPSRTRVVSSAGSAAHARRGGRMPEAPARAVMVRKRRRAQPLSAPQVEIVVSKLQSDANLLGVARMAMQ